MQRKRIKHALRLSGPRQKNPGLSPGKRYVIQRIGAYGHEIRVSGNGTTLLLAVRRPTCEAGRRYVWL
jgi:hypothetical protein